jgi:hypothetical protein
MKPSNLPWNWWAVVPAPPAPPAHPGARFGEVVCPRCDGISSCSGGENWDHFYDCHECRHGLPSRRVLGYEMDGGAP